MASSGTTLVSCPGCAQILSEADRFCKSCGVSMHSAQQPSDAAQEHSHPQSWSTSGHSAAARGFGQMFGIHPSIIFLTFIVDVMLFGGEVATMEAILPLSIAVAAMIGVITYIGQIKWYRDDKESALAKALILALLTAIPTALPAFLYVPSGMVGLAHWLRHRNDSSLPYPKTN